MRWCALGFMLLGCSEATVTGDARPSAFWDGFLAENVTDGGNLGASADLDGDGLDAAREAELGTDPELADTDGDGWDDGAEVDGFTDPLASDDHPYQGGWPIDACRNDVVSTGHQVGQVAQAFALPDQFGDTVRLHDFCGQAVLLVGSAMWCGSCIREADDLGEMYETYADRGFIVITLLGETTTGETPTQSHLQEWADRFNLTHPVVADADLSVTRRFVEGGRIGLPSMSLLAPGATVVKPDAFVSTGDVESLLP